VGGIDRAGALQLVRGAAAACERCPLAATRTQVVFGEGDPRARLVLVGEAPGADEDRDGLPFAGRSGRALDALLGEAGLDRPGAFVTNTVKCRPPGDRRPTPAEVDACRPWLDLELSVVRPEVVVALGATASRRLVDDRATIASLVGRVVVGDGIRRLAAYHPSPSSLNRGPGRRAAARAALEAARRELEEAGLER
jgi:uracil-DNA glycosylase